MKVLVLDKNVRLVKDFLFFQKIPGGIFYDTAYKTMASLLIVSNHFYYINFFGGYFYEL